MAEEKQQKKTSNKFVGDEDEARAILEYHRKLRQAAQAASQALVPPQKGDDVKDGVKDHA